MGNEKQLTLPVNVNPDFLTRQSRRVVKPVKDVKFTTTAVQLDLDSGITDKVKAIQTLRRLEHKDFPKRYYKSNAISKIIKTIRSLVIDLEVALDLSEDDSLSLIVKDIEDNEKAIQDILDRDAAHTRRGHTPTVQTRYDTDRDSGRERTDRTGSSVRGLNRDWRRTGISHGLNGGGTKEEVKTAGMYQKKFNFGSPHTPGSAGAPFGGTHNHGKSQKDRK